MDENAKKCDHDPIMIASAQSPNPPSAAAGGKPLSLAGCERLLQASLGASAPALITLRRHAKAGLLDACRHQDASNAESGRAQYVPSKILGFYENRVNPPGDEGDADSQGKGSVSSNIRPGPGAGQGLAPELIAAMESLRKDQERTRAALAELGDRVSSLSAQVRDLNAVRASLMAKYDAAAAAASERAERLEQENRTLRRMDDPNARALARLQIDLSKVLGLLQTFNAGENNAF